MEQNTSRHESVQEATRTRDWWKSLILRMFQFGFTSCSYDKVTLRTDHGTFEMTGKVGGMLDSADAFDLLTKMGEYNSFTFESYKGNKIASFIYIPALRSPVIDLIFHKGVDYRLQNDFVRVFPEIPYAFDYYGLDARYDNSEIWDPLGKLLDDHGFSYDVIWNGGDDEVWPSTGECDMILSSLSPFHVRLTNKDDNRFVGLLDFEESGRVSLHENYTSDMGDIININESIIPWINARIHQTETKEEEASPKTESSALCSQKDAYDACAINGLWKVVKESLVLGIADRFELRPAQGEWTTVEGDPNSTSLKYVESLHGLANGFATIVAYDNDQPVFSFIYAPEVGTQLFSFVSLCNSDNRATDKLSFSHKFKQGNNAKLANDSHSADEWEFLNNELGRHGVSSDIYLDAGFVRIPVSKFIEWIGSQCQLTSADPIRLPLVKDGRPLAILEFGESGELFIAQNYTDSEDTREWLKKELLPKFNGESTYAQVVERVCRCLGEVTLRVEWIDVITGTSQPHTVYSKSGDVVKVDTKFERSQYDLDLYIVYSKGDYKNTLASAVFTISGEKGESVQVYNLEGYWLNDPLSDPDLQEKLRVNSLDNHNRLQNTPMYEFESTVDKSRNTPIGVLRLGCENLIEEGYTVFYVGDRFKLSNLGVSMKNLAVSPRNPNYLIIRREEKVIGMLEVDRETLALSLVGGYWGDRKFNIRKWVADRNSLIHKHAHEQVIHSDDIKTNGAVLPDPKTIQHQAWDMTNSVMAFWDERKFDDSINLAVGIVVEYLCYATLLNRSPEFDTRYWNAEFWEKVVNGEEQLVRTGPIHDELMHRISNTFIGNSGFHRRMEEATPTVTLFLAKINDIARAFFPKER